MLPFPKMQCVFYSITIYQFVMVFGSLALYQKKNMHLSVQTANFIFIAAAACNLPCKLCADVTKMLYYMQPQTKM